MPVTPGLRTLCILARRLFTLEGLALVGIAALLGYALRSFVVTLRAAVELITTLALAFGVDFAQVHLAFRLAALPLFKALAALFALRHDLRDALLAGWFVLLAVGIITALLPSQFTGKLPLWLLARLLPGLLALLHLLLSWLLGLLLSLSFALLLALFLARLAVSVIVGGILRAGEGG